LTSINKEYRRCWHYDFDIKPKGAFYSSERIVAPILITMTTPRNNGMNIATHKIALGFPLDNEPNQPTILTILARIRMAATNLGNHSP